MARLVRKPPPRVATAPEATAPAGPLPAAPPPPRFVGIDLHKRTARAAVLDASGKILSEHDFPVTHDAIKSLAKDVLLPADQLAVEATTNTWAFVRLVRPHVARVVVSNPLKTKAIAEANVKTDKVDARVLANLLRCDFLPGVWQPDPETEHDRSLAARRTALVRQRTAVKNRIHAILAQRLLCPPKGGLFSKSGRAWLERLSLDPLGRALIDNDFRLLEAIEGEISSVEQMIAPRCYQDQRVRLLMTLPGVDVSVAHTVAAALGDVSRFPTADQAAAYLGLVPRVKQSAASHSCGSITKAGSSQARWMLVQAAQTVGKHPGPLGAFFRKLAKKKNRNIAVVATARKLATIAWHMLTNNEPYRYALPRCTEEKLAALRVRATGEKKTPGPRAGAKSGSKRGAGQGRSRTVKPLDEVYAKEGLPGRPEPRPGERRMVAESGTAEYVQALCETHVVAKRPRQAKSSPGMKKRIKRPAGEPKTARAT